MKSLSYIFAALVLFAFSSCAEDYDENEDYTAPVRPMIVNAPFPEGADTLKVLAIGNSFTENSTKYLRALSDSANIDEKRFCVFMVMASSAKFSDWQDSIVCGGQVQAECVAGAYPMHSSGTLSEILDQQWDVIVIQQASDASYKWRTFACLEQYIPSILARCGNKNVCLAYQIPWSHTPGEMPYVMKWNIKCTHRMTETYGIDVVIPVGTAIQLARQTSLNDDKYLTYDGWHLNPGMGQYIASCTWYESIIARCFKTDVLDNPAVPAGDYSAYDSALGRRCAKQACLNPYVYDMEVQSAKAHKDKI